MGSIGTYSSFAPFRDTDPPIPAQHLDRLSQGRHSTGPQSTVYWASCALWALLSQRTTSVSISSFLGLQIRSLSDGPGFLNSILIIFSPERHINPGSSHKAHAHGPSGDAHPMHSGRCFPRSERPGHCYERMPVGVNQRRICDQSREGGT